jgi:hypothetical protein
MAQPGVQLEAQQLYQAIEKSLKDQVFAPIYFFFGDELAPPILISRASMPAMRKCREFVTRSKLCR